MGKFKREERRFARNKSNRGRRARYREEVLSQHAMAEALILEERERVCLEEEKRRQEEEEEDEWNRWCLEKCEYQGYSRCSNLSSESSR